VQLRLGHPLAVEERAVGAPLIDHEPSGAAPLDESVLARDGAVAHDDVATGIAADEGLVRVDLDRAAASGGHEPQVGHVIAPPR
jgi:hypothetical protein